MTKEELITKLYEKDIEGIGLWYVAYVYKDAFGNIDSNYAYFNERYDAETWIEEKTKGKAFYGFCCDRNCWNRLGELLSE